MVAKNIIERFQRAQEEYGMTGSIRRFILQKSPIHISFIYAINTPVHLRHAEGVSVERFSQKHLVRSEILDSLRHMQGEVVLREIDKLFGRKSELWLAWLNGQIAGMCWTTHGRIRNDYFFPLDRNDGTIFSCFVFHEYRGRGIYPFMLQTIINTLLEKDQLRNVYIDCKSWNYPSIRGIQKAGFSQLGRAMRMKLFGHTWVLHRQYLKSGGHL